MKFGVQVDKWSLVHFLGSGLLLGLFCLIMPSIYAVWLAVVLGFLWETWDSLKPLNIYPPIYLFQAQVPDSIKRLNYWLMMGLFTSEGKFDLADLAFDVAGVIFFRAMLALFQIVP